MLIITIYKGYQNVYKVYLYNVNMGFLKSDLIKIAILALLLLPMLSLFAPIILFLGNILPCTLSLDNLCGLFLIITAGVFVFIIYIIACFLVYVYRKVMKKNID